MHLLERTIFAGFALSVAFHAPASQQGQRPVVGAAVQAVALPAEPCRWEEACWLVGVQRELPMLLGVSEAPAPAVRSPSSAAVPSTPSRAAACRAASCQAAACRAAACRAVACRAAPYRAVACRAAPVVVVTYQVAPSYSLLAAEEAAAAALVAASHVEVAAVEGARRGVQAPWILGQHRPVTMAASCQLDEVLQVPMAWLQQLVHQVHQVWTAAVDVVQLGVEVPWALAVFQLAPTAAPCQLDEVHLVVVSPSPDAVVVRAAAASCRGPSAGTRSTVQFEYMCQTYLVGPCM